MSSIAPRENNNINVNSSLGSSSKQYTNTKSGTVPTNNSNRFSSAIRNNVTAGGLQVPDSSIMSSNHEKWVEEFEFSDVIERNNIGSDPFLNSRELPGIAENTINNAVEKITNGITQIFGSKPKTISKYSNTSHSDMDNININLLRSIMVDVQNALNAVSPEYYEFFTNYCTGKRLSDIIDEKGYLRKIETNNPKDIEMVNAINTAIIKAQTSDGTTFPITGLSAEMLASTVEEIVFTESGYDAFVLRHPNGNYMIVNSSTNSKSANDMVAILYSMLTEMFGSTELFDYLIGNILSTTDYGLILDDLIPNLGDKASLSEYFRKIYNGQIKDNENLINKYNIQSGKDGVKLELYGFSLGGGLMAAAYCDFMAGSGSHSAEIREKNELLGLYKIFVEYELIYCPDVDIASGLKKEYLKRRTPLPEEVQNYIDNLEFDSNKRFVRELFSGHRYSSFTNRIFCLEFEISELIEIQGTSNISNVTVYNPFMLIAEENPNSNFKKLLNDDKFLIYSAQHDFVSLWYGFVEEFQNKTVYLQAKDAQPLNLENFDFNQLIDIIIGGAGNHGCGAIKDAFDENGNIIQEADFKGIKEYVERSMGLSNGSGTNLLSGLLSMFSGLSLGTEYKFNSSIIFKAISIGINQNIEIDDLPKWWKPRYTKKLVNDISDYFEDNYGNCRKEAFRRTFADSAASILKDIIYDNMPPDLMSNFEDVIDFVLDEECLSDAITRYLKQHPDTMSQIISAYLSGTLSAETEWLKDVLIEIVLLYIPEFFEEKHDELSEKLRKLNLSVSTFISIITQKGLLGGTVSALKGALTVDKQLELLETSLVEWVKDLINDN